jgi:hypothetical protein
LATVRSTRASRRSVIAIAGTVQAHSAVWPTCGSSAATAARVVAARPWATAWTESGDDARWIVSAAWEVLRRDETEGKR